MSTIALAIGLGVGNLLNPGSGLNITPNAASVAKLADQAHSAGGTWDFIASIIPTSMLSSLTAGSVLQTLFVALLVGFAIQSLGKSGEPILKAVGYIQKLVFKILTMILWLAPIGAFGAIASVVGQTGLNAVVQLGTLMIGFYLTCLIFVFGVLGTLLRAVTGFNIFKLVKYLAREYLLIFATSSSESALPRLIAKMEHVGVERTTVGIVVPTGYSFNLDGTAIYLTMASIFIADAMGQPLAFGEQLSLLVFMIIASRALRESAAPVWPRWPADCRAIAPNFSTASDSSSESTASCRKRERSPTSRAMRSRLSWSARGPRRSTRNASSRCSTGRFRSTKPRCSTTRTKKSSTNSKRLRPAQAVICEPSLDYFRAAERLTAQQARNPIYDQ